MNATATVASRQRKPRAKPARSIRLAVPLNAEGKNGLASITVGKKTDEYFLTRIAADWGTAFQLEKLGADEVYHVNLNGAADTCDRKGHLRHGHCKHSEGLRALARAGKL